MTTEKMTFELCKSQIEKLRAWQESIEEKYGKYGEYKFIFTPTGIGVVQEVYSEIAKETLNLTEYEKW